MSDVFDLIFSLFENVLTWLDKIPVWDGVSLKDFSFAAFIFGIISSALLMFAKSPVAFADVSVKEYRRQRAEQERAVRYEKSRKNKNK